LIGSIILSGTVSAADITVTSDSNIQKAVDSANSGDTLNLQAGTYKQHNIQINKDLTIKGPYTTDSPTAIIDGQNSGSVFQILKGTSVTLQYLTIQNGNTATDSYSSDGAGIFNKGTLTVNNCIIQKNTAKNGYGGGIYNYGGIVNLSNSKVISNTALNGGGIRNYNGGSVTLTGSNVYSNVATHYEGGGIDNYYSSLTLTNSNIFNNIAKGPGGGIYNYYGTVSSDYLNLYQNTAYFHGGESTIMMDL